MMSKKDLIFWTFVFVLVSLATNVIGVFGAMFVEWNWSVHWLNPLYSELTRLWALGSIVMGVSIVFIYITFPVDN